MASFTTFTALFARYGLSDYLRKITYIQARMPDEAEALLLRPPIAAPLLVTEAVDVDCTGVPITYSVARWAAERVQLSIGE